MNKVYKITNPLNLVRILEPARQVPYITAPSRSRLGSVEVDTVSTPVRTYGEQFLSVNYHGSKNSPADRYDYCDFF